MRAYVQIFISLFVLVNPLEGIPFFLAKTRGSAKAIRADIARRSAIAVTVILLVSAVVGGGIILFLIALQMALGGVNGGKGPAVADDHAKGADIAIMGLLIAAIAAQLTIEGLLELVRA